MPTAGISRVAPIGKRFGRVVVISLSRPSGRSTVVDARCDCGDERPYFISNLRTQSEPMCPACREASRPAKGQSGKHPLFNIWKAMIQRCENPNHTWFKRYGGRGVAVCPKWRDDFEAFAADVGDRPSLKHTIDRVDGNGHYEPDNVRWATHIVQQRNRSDTLRVEWDGRTMSGKEAADIAGLELATFYYRVKAGWPMERIMSTPSTMTANKGQAKRRRGLSFKGEHRTIAEWARLMGLTPATVHQRLKRGASIEQALTKPMRGSA